jgi:hypothetical protein
MLNLLFIAQIFAFFSFGVGGSDLSIFFLIFVLVLSAFHFKLKKSNLLSYICIVGVSIIFLVHMELAIAKILASMILIYSIYSIASDRKKSLSVNTVFLFSIIWFGAVIATLGQ